MTRWSETGLKKSSQCSGMTMDGFSLRTVFFIKLFLPGQRVFVTVAIPTKTTSAFRLSKAPSIKLGLGFT